MKGIDFSLVLFFSPNNLDSLCQLSRDKMSLKVVFLTEKLLNQVKNPTNQTKGATEYTANGTLWRLNNSPSAKWVQADQDFSIIKTHLQG